jgi:hypothetical protein
VLGRIRRSTWLDLLMEGSETFRVRGFLVRLHFSEAFLGVCESVFSMQPAKCTRSC